MIIQRTTVGSERVELQQHPVILPTTAWEGLTQGERNQLTNDALKYAIIVWDGDELVSVLASAALKGAVQQYRIRVQQTLGIDADLGFMAPFYP